MGVHISGLVIKSQGDACGSPLPASHTTHCQPQVADRSQLQR
jgi:hypothetical protein